jgi:hypothetical protein
VERLSLAREALPTRPNGTYTFEETTTMRRTFRTWPRSHRHAWTLVLGGLIVASAGGPRAVLAAEPEGGFSALFNGADLTGWEGDPKLWIVEHGLLIGRSPGIKHNDFLATTRSYRDFILRFEIRLVDGQGNTGVQFRSKRVPPPSHEVAGYQADFAPGYWGKLYDESRRNRVLAGPDAATLEKVLRATGWNQYEVQARGHKITLLLNGVKTVDYTEQDSGIAPEGVIAVQIHGGGPMEGQFKNIRLQELK